MKTKYIYIAIILIWSIQLKAQYVKINGPTSVIAGSTHTYTVTYYNANGLPMETPTGYAEWMAGGGVWIVGLANNISSVTVTISSAGDINYYYAGFYDEINVSIASASAPVATSATSVTSQSFNANWNSVSGATSYRLDVSSNSAFTSFLSGYNNLSVTGTSKAITGLEPSNTYYYRVRAVTGSGTSPNSNVVATTTLPYGPSAFPATNIHTTGFTANWLGVPGVSGYRLDVSTVQTFNTFVPGYNNLSLTSTSKTITGLTPGTTYYYRVRSEHNGLVSGNSNVISLSTIPSPPLILPATSFTTSSLTLNWGVSPGATSYRLDVSKDSYFLDFVSGFNNRTVTGTSSSVTGLQAGTRYYFRVRAVNSGGTSTNSVETETMTLPAAPVAIAATGITTNGFTAKWNSSPGYTLSGYQIDVSLNNTFTSMVNGYNNKIVPLTTSTSITGLAPGTTYYYRVRAQNNSGASANSNTISVITIPSAPVCTSATSATASGFTANWNSVTGATGYRLDVSLSLTFNSFVSNYNNLNVTGTSSVVTGLSPNTTYYYRVRAVNSSGTSANSNVITAITMPAAPVATTASSITSSGFTANWNSVSGATGYRLDVSLNNTFTSFVNGYNNLSVTQTSTSVTGLASGTPYYYRVRAVSGSNSSANSNIVTAVTLPVAPVASAGASITTSGFTAAWNNVTGATGYRLDVSTNNSFTPLLANYSNLSVSNTSITVTGLAAGTTYYYRVRATNSSGSSSNSNVVQPVTLPVVPSPAEASNHGLHSFTANWTSTNGAATTYRLDVSLNNSFSSFVSGYNDKSVSGLSQVVTGLAPGAIYYYRVRAVTSTGTSANSSTATTNTVPAAPSALPETNMTSNSFTANWSAVAGATGYRLDVSTSSTFNTFVSGYQNLAVSGTTRVVSGLNAKVVYYFRVRAEMNGRISDNSNTRATASLDRNFIKTSTILTANIKEANIENATLNQKSVNYQFFDGLGRLSQSVAKQQSPLQSDIVQPVVYDVSGRESVKYLPYVSGSDGWYKADFINKENLSYFTNSSASPHFQFYQSTTNVAADTNPYAITVFEKAPNPRVIEQGAPGTPWQPDATDAYTSSDRTIKYGYETNTGNEVLFWSYTPPTSSYPFGVVNAGSATSPAFYAANQLYKNKTKDEHYNEVIQYMDLKGKIVLKRVQVTGIANASTTNADRDTNWASTYYIYDDFENLVCVIPPEATRLLSTQYFQAGASDASKEAFMKRWAFRYSYDDMRRMNKKQVPGAEPVYMVYDNRDRLVLTQDGNQRAGSTKYWTFTKYDALNRPVLTGIYNNNNTLDQVQTAVNNYYSNLTASQAWFETFTGSGSVHGYDNKSFPQVTDGNSYLTVTYYDNYAFKSLWIGDYNYVNDALSQTLNSATYNQPTSENFRVTGQVTGTKTKVLDGGITGGYTWLKTVNYYDDKYRIIQTISDNYKGGFDRISSLSDFTGKVLKTKSVHVERDVLWKDLVGVKQEGNKLIRTVSGANWGASGAASTQQLAAGANGWVEFQASETNLYRMVGLSDQNTDASYTSLDYAWYPMADGTLMIYESSTNRGTFGSYASGDVLKIERTGTTVRYYHNNVLKYTSPNSSSSILMVDVALHGLNSTIVNVRTSFSETVRTTHRRFVYDHAGRLLETWHKLDSEPEVLIARNEYNELGQLVTKKLHSRNSGSTFAQTIDYRYNIRGWLDNINDPDAPQDNDLFSMDLRYNDPTSQGGAAQFNGNISEIRWAGAGTGKQSYGYRYDQMNRLTKARYYSANHALQNGRYDEWVGNPDANIAGYDLNGNIVKLYRYGEMDAAPQGKIDELSYHYVGNQLKIVNDAIADNSNEKGFKELVEKTFNVQNTDAQNEYAYDANGNMIKDDNKGITAITYNHLNLPAQVNKDATNYLAYIYDATGRKLKQQVYGSTPKTTDYAGEFIYQDDVLQFINHEEGRIIPASSGNSEYQYHLKDHLGNVRVTFSEKTTSTSYLATFERSPSSIETSENAMFLNINNIKKINATMYNHTPGSGKSYSYRLSGSPGEVVGPARSFAVAAGDAIDMEVYARYNAPTSGGSAVGTFATALISAFALNSAGTGPIDGSQAYNAFNDEFASGAWITAGDYEDNTAPKAFLNYLLFDQNFELVDAGFDQVTQAGATAHDYLSLHVKVEQAGFLYIYLSNEGAVIQDVYFDDFKIVRNTRVEQVDDYYPFGLAFNSYQRENSTKNNYLYNGKELQDELALNVLDFGWRTYDPTIGRFTAVDAFADKYFSMTPYQYGANNPIKYVDINGDSLMLFKNGAYVATVDNGKEEITGYNQLSETDEDGNETFTGGYQFGFNDIDTDRSALKSGEMTVELISNDAIESASDGAREAMGDENRYSFIKRESRLQNEGSKGKMDFWATSDIMKGDNVLHVARSKAGDAVGYNGSDFGNFMWGMAGRKLGFNLTTLRLGAHYNNMMNGKEDNKWNKKYEHQILDAAADQRAIRNGYNYNQKFQENGVVFPRD